MLALEWQRTLSSQRTVVNGITYYGPHKWIICLVGNGNYHIKQFLKDNGDQLRKQDQLSISVLGLSDLPFSQNEVQNMKDLTSSTVEGLFANLTERERSDELVKQFFASLDVYPSEPMPILKETFTAS
jgi:hypothetical protein